MIKLALIGCGNMATTNFLPKFQHLADQIRIVATVDIQKNRAHQAASLFENARPETDYRKILEDDAVDATILTLPHHLHHSIALDCLNAGKHVLLEKPMANTEQQCIDLI